MFSGKVVVAGAGVAGLCTALLLARDGHLVTLLERDDARGPEVAPRERKGIPHYLQPHAMIPRARLELEESLPDVRDDLLARGAWEPDLRPRLPGSLLPEDEQLRYLAVRRPQLEAALRRAVLAESRITWRTSCRVTDPPESDLLVDALGRGSRLKQPTESTDCGVVYYCRYYRQRPGFELPDGPWLLSPRGDLGYFAFSTFPGDSGTFAAVLAVPPGVAEWKAFREPRCFEAAVASIATLSSWADPDQVDPITDVLPMAGLRNVAPTSLARPGVVAVGDALGHTDPVLAHGLAFSLIHARAVRDSARGHDDPGDLAASYLEDVRPLLQERFEFASQLDEQRLRRWQGGEVDLARNYALFSMLGGAAVASVDPAVFRVHVRRIGLLDSTGVLDGDHELRKSIATQLAGLTPRVLGPGREEMAELVHAAARS